MKKRKIIIICIPIIIALILSGFFILNNRKGFRGTQWGMGMKEVKALEKSKGNTSSREISNNGKIGLCYDIKWNNYNSTVIYDFTNTDKLDNIVLGIEDVNLTDNDMNNIIVNLKKELSAKDKNIETKKVKLSNGELNTTTLKNKDTKATLMQGLKDDGGSQCIIKYEPIK